jgi:hypothetical protein
MSEPVMHRAVGAWRIQSAEPNYNVLDATGGIVATFFGPDALYCAIAFLFAPQLVGLVRRADQERRVLEADWYDIGCRWLEREIAIVVDRINNSVPDQKRRMKNESAN